MDTTLRPIILTLRYADSALCKRLAAMLLATVLDGTHSRTRTASPPLAQTSACTVDCSQIDGAEVTVIGAGTGTRRAVVATFRVNRPEVLKEESGEWTT